MIINDLVCIIIKVLSVLMM